MAASAIKSVTVYPLAIPLRQSVDHAAQQRRVADPVVVAVELYGGAVGYGETLARPYVTGETPASVVDSITNHFVECMMPMSPAAFPVALESIDALPWRDGDGNSIAGARAAVELALLDAYARQFGRSTSDIAGWMGFHEFAAPGSLRTVRISSVLASNDPARLKRTIRRTRWFGLHDFKLKVGDAADDERVRLVWSRLRRAVSAGRATLRIDANAAWTVDRAIERLAEWSDVSLIGVEQPLPRNSDEQLPRLRAETGARIIHDESLCTIQDAERLISMGVADAFNIRISKCGGFLASLRLARLARKHGVSIVLGCMVGETSILSAAARRFLELVPHVRLAEGNFGTWLIERDVVRRPLRFGYGGRVGSLPGPGWGIDVEPRRLESLSLEPPRRIEF